MAKKSANKPGNTFSIWGYIKWLFISIIFLVTTYVACHIYFLARPADERDPLSEQVMNLEIQGFKPFPAVNVYTTEGIAGREEVLKGWLVKTPLLKERLANAVKGGHSITFREEEINAWLSRRLSAKQDGYFGKYVKDVYVWVDLSEGQMDLIIERTFANDYTHVTSMLLEFTRLDRGYGIRPYSAQIGQVKAPGGLARLVSDPFSSILEELSEDLLPYSTREIQDIHVEEGKITLDPQTLESREAESVKQGDREDENIG